MFATSFVLGYHGCDRRVGEGILRNDTHVAVSKNRYDWLGEGAYFWENSPERAREWAEFLKKHPPEASRRIADPFVVVAIIDLGNCLDLTDATSLEIVRGGYDEFQRANALAGADPGAKILAKTHVQVCVRNPAASIKGYFRPLP